MSLKRHANATLIGYGSPHFPDPGTTALNAAVSAARFNGAQLEEALKTLTGFQRIKPATTSDGYTWFWQAWFLIRGEMVAICFPWGGDHTSEDGSHLERSCAIYGSDALAGMVSSAAAVAIRRSYYASNQYTLKLAPVDALRIGDVVFCRTETGGNSVTAIAMVSHPPSGGTVCLILLDVIASSGDREYVTGDLVMAIGDEIFQ